jgi:ribosomal protein S18 acetylase RimI-like enzyme
MDNLNLYILKEGELESLQQISLQTFTDGFFHLNTPKYFYEYTDRAFSVGQLKSELQNPNTQFQFLKSDNTLLGYFKLNFNSAQSDIRDPNSLEIERIYILKEYQNLGLGKYLLDKIKEIAIQKNLHYIWLGVWEKNADAIRFYEKNGFRIFSSHDFHMGSEVQTDVLMRWERIRTTIDQ